MNIFKKFRDYFRNKSGRDHDQIASGNFENISRKVRVKVREKMLQKVGDFQGDDMDMPDEMRREYLGEWYDLDEDE